MKNQNQNDELTSRREFLKKAVKAVLPAIAIIGLGLPMISCEKDDPRDCQGTCMGTCYGSCEGNCSTSCNSN